jgi:hypothetical protein
MLGMRSPAESVAMATPVEDPALVTLVELAGEGFGDGPYVKTLKDAADVLAARLGDRVTLDDLGRRVVPRQVARGLFAEREEQALRWREMQARLDAEAAEQAARNRPWAGIPAGSYPDDVLPASAMLQAAADARPRRQSPLEHALENSGQIEYHPVAQVPE